MTRTSDENQSPSKKWNSGAFLTKLGSIFNRIISLLLRSQKPKKLVQIGRAFYTEEMASNVKHAIQFFEIEHYITDEKNLLAQNKSPHLKSALNQLKEQHLKKNGRFDYQENEELLDKINALIIYQKMHTSKRTNSKMLNCDNAFLTRIPQEVFRKEPAYWQQLESISLQNNRLTTLPEQIRQLTALKQLNITGNTIGTLPSTMNELIKLEEIHLPADTVKYYEPQTPFLPSKPFAKNEEANGICFKAPSTQPVVSLPRKVRSS